MWQQLVTFSDLHRYRLFFIIALWLASKCSAFSSRLPDTHPSSASQTPNDTDGRRETRIGGSKIKLGTTHDASVSPVTVSLEKQAEIERSSLDSINTERDRLQWKLIKQVRQVAKDYDMLQDKDHIMVCVSGGKDSATLLVLLKLLQDQLAPMGVDFRITAVHVDQKQPGYNGTALINWLRDDLHVDYKIVEEDTYSTVVDKTKPNQSYCTLCSRLRRGILYSTAMELGCNKIALGHHADDALETLLLNMLHAGQLKAMPARYTSQRGKLAVLRPLIKSMEDDIGNYAALAKFPILPCNLCSSQGLDDGERTAVLQRPQVKLLLSTLESLNPNAKQNMLRSLTDIRPSHLLDQALRASAGIDPVSGDVLIDDAEGDDETFLDRLISP